LAMMIFMWLLRCVGFQYLLSHSPGGPTVGVGEGCWPL